MIRKAKSLPEIMNMFHPEALTAEQMAFYQPTAAARRGDEYEYHEKLFSQIRYSDKNLHLAVVGHVGCGKSTELRMLAQKLENDGTPSITIKATADLSMNDFTYIDISMLIVKHLVDYAENKKLEVSKKAIKAFTMAVSTKTTEEYWESGAKLQIEAEAEASVTIPLLARFMTRVAASLKMGSGIKEEVRREIRPQMPNIIEAVNALIDNLNGLVPNPQKGNNIVIIIDGLEKCHQECVRKLFTDDVSSLTSINTHLVIACPISLYRSEDATSLSANFESIDVMPMIKTHNNDKKRTRNKKGVALIKELILKRVDESFFEKGVIEKIITMTGGHLRDTFFLIKDSAIDSILRNRTTIDMKAVNHTLNKYAADRFLMVHNDYYGKVRAIYEGDHRSQNDSKTSALLRVSAVLEYNGERWVDLHPLVRYHIDKNPGVLDD